MKRALVCALALAACAAPAREPSAAANFAPLIGCWRGAFEGEDGIHDERCFQVLGEHVVDTHHVRPTTYAGETTYHLDETAGVIVFAYASNDGARSNGSVRVDGARYVFAPHTHRGADGTEQRLRSIWMLEPSGRLVMTSERQEEGAWRRFMRVTYTRAPDIRPPS